MIIGRSSRLTHFLEWRDYKIVFKRYPLTHSHTFIHILIQISMDNTFKSDAYDEFRYASLYFAAGIEKEDNELIVLDIIHHFVETLDRYFGNVCELDLIFNFHQAYFILEEIIIGGFIMESSKKQVLKMIQQNDALMDEAFFKDEGQGKNAKDDNNKSSK